jgi:hypothetical protein
MTCHQFETISSCRALRFVEVKMWENGSKTRKQNSNTGYQHRKAQKKRSCRKSVGPSDSRYRRSDQTSVVRGRVVSIVLRSGNDDHDTDESRGALPLARFLPSYSRDLTRFDGQGAVDTGGGRVNLLPPRTFFLSASPIAMERLVLVLVLGLQRSNQ